MKTVDAYVDGLPSDRFMLCAYLRQLIITTVPGVEERLSFRIPFYHYYGMFMYLNNTKQGIDVAFCRGKDLIEAFPLLELKNRATIATITIVDKKQVLQYDLPQLIATAAEWNKEAKALKIPIIKN
jgi:uncharacterized protein